MARLKSIQGRKIRLAVLGCGRISHGHFDAIAKCAQDIELVAVCDRDPASVEQAARQVGGRSYTDLTAMLTREDLDLVVVATPNGLHSQHAMQIADHHIHVLTEKPMAVKLEDGLNMQAHCAQKGVQLYVLYQNRFNGPSQALRQACQKKRFGKIYLITSNLFWMRPQSYYEGWHGTRDIDGGMLYTQASHYIDLMLWLAEGEVKTVYANLKTLGRSIETADTGTICLEWDSGILGSLNITVLTYPDNLEGSLTILGERGTARVGGIAMNEIQHWEFAQGQEQEPGDMAKAANYHTDSVYGFGHIPYYQSLVQAFRGQPRCPTGYCCRGLGFTQAFGCHHSLQ